MAENQSLKAPKQAKREIEQEIEENKHLVEPQNSIRSIGAVSDCLTDEAVMKKNGSQAEPHLESLLNLPDSDAKPVIATPLASVGPEESKVGQFAVSHQQALASVTAQAAQHQEHKQLQAEYQLPLVPLKPSEASAISPRSLQQRPSTLEQDSNACTPECDRDSSPDKDIKPIPLKPSVASAISPRPLQQRPSTLEQDSNACKPECDGGSSSDKEIKPTRFTVKTPTNDGFNWRKYGQKPVKSSESSRSYYRCTTADCHAKKKVEFCDKTGNVTEIVYKGQHNHDPPQQTRHSKLKRLAASFVPLSSSGTGGGGGLIDCPIIADFYSDPSSSSRELTRATPDQQLKAEEPDQAIIIKSEDCIDEPNSKHSRKKGTSFAYSPSLFKHVKDSKVVVQAPGDVSISGDGYRWRKYGQKMVKGNPYPRSYYKCTFAGGCPVRKHVERSTEDTNSFIITYEGKHEHEKPVPRKCHDLASTIPLTPTTPAVDSAEVNKSKDLATHKVSAQWSMDIESPTTNQKATEFGGQKALESARTLLSIGIELRPY